MRKQNKKDGNKSKNNASSPKGVQGTYRYDAKLDQIVRVDSDVPSVASRGRGGNSEPECGGGACGGPQCGGGMCSSGGLD